MITKAEKEKIKKILGWRYAPLVQAYMNKGALQFEWIALFNRHDCQCDEWHTS